MQNNFIEVYDDIVDQESCETIIKHFEMIRNDHGCVSRQDRENTSKLIKDTNYYELTQTSDQLSANVNSIDNEIITQNDRWIFNTFKTAFWKCYNEYIQKYDLTTTSVHSLDGYVKIQKTLPGEGYHQWHWEQDCVLHGHRLLLVMLYLNDVEEGGETEFLYQSTRVKPKQGRMMICPASFTHTHRGNPPLIGEKYVMNTWTVYLK